MLKNRTPPSESLWLENERWHEVIDFPAYWISDHGRIWSTQWNAFLLLNPSKSGYVQVKLWRANRPRCCSFGVHQLVAQHFVVNMYNDPEVNHMDGIKHNNYFGNLEWCTPLQNTNHAIVTGLRSGTPRPAEQYDSEDEWMMR